MHRRGRVFQAQGGFQIGVLVVYGLFVYLPDNVPWQHLVCGGTAQEYIHHADPPVCIHDTDAGPVSLCRIRPCEVHAGDAKVAGSY